MTSCDCPAIPASMATFPRSFARRVLDRFIAAQTLARQRRHLSRLDDALLRDIGLTRHQTSEVANRPNWDAPNHWRS